MIFCALAHLSCSLFVVTFCCSSLPNPLNCGSQLTAYNVARKESGEPEANENDASIYAMENKSAWRIDGSKWKDVCSLASCLIVMRDIVCHNLQSYIKHHPESQKKTATNINVQQMDDRVGVQSHFDLQNAPNKKTA